jgi:hypothetical protein
MLAHEIYHVVSRANPALSERLNQAIGFVKVENVIFPEEIRRRLISNPDALTNDHFIRVEVDGEPVCAAPLLLFTIDRYDPSSDKDFFEFMEFQYLAAAHVADRNPANLHLIPWQKASGFFEQVGWNTDYNIHPEEILAENFALLITGRGQVKSPRILDQMRWIFAHPTDSTADPPAPTCP